MTSHITEQNLPYEIMKVDKKLNRTGVYHSIGYIIPTVDTTATIAHEWAVLNVDGNPLSLGPEPYKTFVHSIILAAGYGNPFSPTTYVIGNHALKFEVWLTVNAGVVNTSYDIKLTDNIDVTATWPNVRTSTFAHNAVYNCRYFTLRLDNTGGDGSSYLRGNKERYNFYALGYGISDFVHYQPNLFPPAPDP